MKVQTNPQTSSKGMDVFLQSSTKKEIQTEGEKMKVDVKPKLNPSPQKIDQKVGQVPVQDKQTKATTEIEEIEEKIKDLEMKLDKARALEFSQFNQVVFQKQLRFKTLFITSKIYVLVENNEGRKTIVSIIPPRWGGSGLRYMISMCAENWCRVVEKSTSKGKILTYQSLASSTTDNDDIDDIFD
jgi:hypothetical protein